MIQRTIKFKKAMEGFNSLMSTWVTPILLSIVGFFVMGILTDVKDIKANQILFMKEQATMQAKIVELERRMDGHEKWLDEIDKSLQSHERESAARSGRSDR